MLIIDEIKRVRKMARNFSGAVASLTFDNLIGSSENYLKTIEIAIRASRSDSTVLLLGESGTGKDVIAQSIHNGSNRKNGPFVAINCGAIPRELIGSELFGYVEGAFTGARKGGSVGKFELADGGTIFLDEIGDMPLDMQTNLLRVIEERKITRIGDQDVIPIDVRIIVATNRDLSEEVKNNRFRQDLYYRLNVITIHLCPLRERKKDIPELVSFFYKQLISNMNKKEYPIPKNYLDILSKYDFPGNIRELQNIIECSVNLSMDGLLESDFVPEEILASINNKSYNKATRNDNLSLDDIEKLRIEELLAKYEGNITKVSYELGVARSTLYRKFNKYGFTKNITSR
ncbi:MAG: sigma-54 interaction domain-containing protein [Sedimentibacter sp.]